MKTTQGILLLLFFSILSFSVEAQRNRAADADVEYGNGGYHVAASMYQVALKKITKIEEKGRVLFQIGECYRKINKLEESEQWYRKSITAKYYKTDMNCILNFAKVLMMQGKYDEAIVQINRFKDKGGNAKQGDELIKTCEQATEWVDLPPTRYIVENEVVLNSKNYDFAPRFSSKKNNEMIFSSSRPASIGSKDDPISGESFMDLFSSKQDKKGKWSTPVGLGAFVNSEHNEGSTEFDKKMKNLYFTRCMTGDDRVGCKIFTSTKSGANYTMAEEIVIDIETPDTIDFGHPALTLDQKHMIFASDMKGGQGGVDLWIMAYDKKKKKWSEPVNLGKDINTADDEAFPYIRDNGTLYYSSNGMGGLGGFDLFSAESTGERTWSSPVNMQFPINSSADDFGIIFEKAEDAGYFTSDRQGGKGLDDIYSFKLPPLVFTYVGNVYDNDTGEPISNVKVTVVETPGGGSYELTTDGNGGFSLTSGEVQKENTYTLAFDKDKYFSTRGEFSTVGLTESADLIGEHFMMPISEEPYEMPLVLYPFNEDVLLINEEVDCRDSLNYLLEIMQNNPTFVIELQSHTDSRGGDDYNLELSQRRAQTCVDYILSKGIDKDRLTAKGKGETVLKVADATINAMATEEDKEKGHQINRRTEFTVVRYDYVPKPKGVQPDPNKK